MCLLRKITYGEFSEFVGEKKLHIENMLCSFKSIVKNNYDLNIMAVISKLTSVCKIRGFSINKLNSNHGMVPAHTLYVFYVTVTLESALHFGKSPNNYFIQGNLNQKKSFAIYFHD